MKSYFLNLMLMLLFSVTSLQTIAQTKTNKLVTDTITIKGNCGECKARIEEAAYTKGVKTAEWNKTTKILTVVYNSEKTSRDKIQASIANAGHDSDRHTASDKSYKSLPSCCAYRTGVCAHD